MPISRLQDFVPLADTLNAKPGTVASK